MNREEKSYSFPPLRYVFLAYFSSGVHILPALEIIIYYSTVQSGVMFLPCLSQQDKVLHSPFKYCLLSESRCYQTGRRLTVDWQMNVSFQREILYKKQIARVCCSTNMGNSMGTKGNSSRCDLTFYKVGR